LQPISTVTITPFEFRPIRTVKKTSAIVSQVQKELDIDLRHNILQETLHRQLAEEYGNENVGDEQQSGIGTSIDVVVRQKGEYWFYEIKTSHSPRACLRQAIGQLLEYTLWPGTQEATRLIVVGEMALDEAGAEYLRKLREHFCLPIEYKQIVV
jgi:hypothetical protein